jgi:hypothetical protein
MSRQSPAVSAFHQTFDHLPRVPLVGEVPVQVVVGVRGAFARSDMPLHLTGQPDIPPRRVAEDQRAVLSLGQCFEGSAEEARGRLELRRIHAAR